MRESRQRLAASGIPKPCCAVAGSGHHLLPVGTKSGGIHRPVVLERPGSGQHEIAQAQHRNGKAGGHFVVGIIAQESAQIGERIGPLPDRGQFLDFLPLQVAEILCEPDVRLFGFLFRRCNAVTHPDADAERDDEPDLQ